MDQRFFTPDHDAILDTTTRPQDDFFSYVNANWIANNPIPASESRWGQFSVLRDEAWQAMRTIYENLQHEEPKKGSVARQARDFYYTGMHYDEFEAEHLKELEAINKKIDAITNASQLALVTGELHAMGANCFWGSYVDSDNSDSKKHIFHLHQAGLTLPDRDYYLENNKKMQDIRSHYKQHVGRIRTRLPHLASSDDSLWSPLIALETELATISRSSADLRDVENNYNKTTLTAIKKDYPTIDWDAYAQGLGWQADDKITVDQPEFFGFINQKFQGPLDDLKLYLKWCINSQFFSRISTECSLINFEFFGRVLNGTTEIMPQWKRVTLQLEGAIGDATGQLYVKEHFPEASKAQVQELVENVRSAYAERLTTLDWLSDEHKTYAKKKLHNMKVLIGYPDTWRDFSGLHITRSSYLQNIIAAGRFETAYWLKKLHQPTSRDEWLMTPQTVNAYHDPNRLVICFPAAILQKPFFSPQASLASNMGGIGSVIGHELTHGFDDQGCMFDAEGNVRTWQSKEERAAFDKKAQIIVNQADTFSVLPGLTLKGRLVLGESIADLGGIEIALHAFKTMLGNSPQKNDAIRQFFINYAYTECGATREEKLREFALTDPHPLSEFRVNGILQHIDDFYTVFDIKKGDTLYRPASDRAKIW